MIFEWDDVKAESNLRKHGISFNEARTVFLDDMAWLFNDPDHGQDEERFILLGMSAVARVLVVVHCVREGGDVIRIISARRATRNESAAYSGGCK